MQGLPVFASVPPLNFQTAFFLTQRLLDSQITSGNKQNLRPRRGSGARCFHDTIASAVDILEGVVLRVSATLPNTSAMLSGPNFLTSCKGQLFLHFQRIAISVCLAACCTRIWRGPFFLRFMRDQFSFIFESNQFSCFFVGQISSIIVECLLRAQLQGPTFLPGSDVHNTNWFSSPVWGHMLA